MHNMNEQQAKEIDQSIQQYKACNARLKEHLPEVAQGYNNFTKSCFADGAISQKDKHLTAIAISIYARDEFCIHYHTKAAVEYGISENELMETIGVAAALGGGTAFSEGVTWAMNTFDYHSQNTH